LRDKADQNLSARFIGASATAAHFQGLPAVFGGKYKIGGAK